MKEEISVPFIVYPNLGENELFKKILRSFWTFWLIGSNWNGSEWTKNENKNEPNLNELFVEWIRLGTKYVGGCCNFNSNTMKEIKNIIKNL